MDAKQKKWIGRGAFLLLIIIIALFALVWSGNLRCSKVPGLCGAYWGMLTIITGRQQPSILILYDPSDIDGIGNPELLRDIIEDKEHLGLRASIQNINYITLDQLSKNSLIVVTKAKKISTLKLITFINYVSQGGRLVWIGDAGTEKEKDDMYYVDSNTNYYSPWIRLTDDNTIIYFNIFLGTDYVTNLCNIINCAPSSSIGKLVPNSEHPLVYGLASNLQIGNKTTYKGEHIIDYSIVKQNGINPIPLYIEFEYNLRDIKDIETPKDYGTSFPAIITSNSNKVAYYAIPPEYLAHPDREDRRYISIVTNMIKGMVN